MLGNFLQGFVKFWKAFLTRFWFVNSFDIFCRFTWNSRFIPFEKILSNCAVHNVFSIFLNQILLIFFCVLGDFGILIKFFLPHLIQHNLLSIFFLILFYHFINLRLTFPILFVRVILSCFREIFIWWWLIHIVLLMILILVLYTFFWFVRLLNIFHLPAMCL